MQVSTGIACGQFRTGFTLRQQHSVRAHPDTGVVGLRWLRERATVGTCSCGAGRRKRHRSVNGALRPPRRLGSFLLLQRRLKVWRWESCERQRDLPAECRG